jgi:hypothetical protein
MPDIVKRRPFCDHFLSAFSAGLLHNGIRKQKISLGKEANIMDWFTILIFVLLLVYTLIPANREIVDEKDE